MNSLALVALAFFTLPQGGMRPPTGPAIGEVGARLDAYERRAAETAHPDPAELAAIGRAVIDQARRSTNFLVWSDACASNAVQESEDCSGRLWTVLNNTHETVPRRAAAAAALMAKGDKTAADALADLLKTAPVSALAQLVTIIEDMPPKQAVPLLVRLSESGSGPEQETACEALSGFDVPEARAAVTKIVDANAPGTPPWLVCMIARARLHEIATPGAVAGYGNTLQGRGQLFAAKVMIETGNDAAVQMLTDLTHRGNASDRLAAAGLLVDVRPDAAIPTVDEGEHNPDPVIRRTAVALETRLKRPPSKLVRSMLVDVDGVARVRAAETVIDWAKRSQSR